MKHRLLHLAAFALSLSACGGGGGGSGSSTPTTETPTTPTTPAAAPRLQTLRTDLDNPWGLAELPTGEWLITQRTGSLLRVSADGLVRATITGTPAVASSGQGGLLDVALDPDFGVDPWVYFCFAEPGSGAESGRAGTAVARARLVGNALQNLTVTFRQQPKVSGSGHFGCRLVFGRDKLLFVSLGERQQGSPAQDLTQTLGKVVRIGRDGSIPADNPSFGSGARPGLWSLGHRNPQGAALHPDTGELWVGEHGPQGGDEINIVRAGANYGWPLVSYGCNYGDPVGDACRIGGGTHAPRFAEPLTTWTPTSVAPSGMAFYGGSLFPEWRGNLFAGSLAGQTLWRLTVTGNAVTAREALFANLGERFRAVKPATDGSLVLITDSGKLLKLTR
jgi:aldose sugar dehydrogenase